MFSLLLVVGFLVLWLGDIGTMIFEDALKYMRYGKKVRRSAWGKYCYIERKYDFYRDNSWFVSHTGQELTTLSVKAIFSVDWEVVEDDKNNTK